MLNLSVKYRRVAALLIDLMIITGFTTLLFEILIYGFHVEYNATYFLDVFAMLFMQSVMGVIYSMGCEKIYHGTLGKRIMKVEIVEGKRHDKLTMVELFSREWSKYIVLYFFSLLAVVINAIMYFGRGTSIHDLFAKTTVIGVEEK